MIFCLVIILSLISAPAAAQEDVLSENSMLDNFKKSFVNNAADKAPAATSFPETSKDQLQKLAQELDVDYETAEIVASLKNPFLPQIPSLKKSNVAPPPPPTETPAPEETFTEPQAPPPQFNVNGMVWNTKAPTALINGRIVRVGDEISTWRVAEINQKGVRMTFQNQELWIKPKTNQPQPLSPPNTYGR